MSLSGATLAAEHFGPPSPVMVKTVTFDQWREIESVDRVDLMKIDVEGFEAQLLAGMVQSLGARRVARLVCETSWDGAAHLLLVEIGFRPTLLERVGSVANLVYDL